MITIEELDDGEVYAVDGHGCVGCMFRMSAKCIYRLCGRTERPDGRNVIYHPIDDVRTTMAYAVQQKTPR